MAAANSVFVSIYNNVIRLVCTELSHTLDQPSLGLTLQPDVFRHSP